MGDSSENNSRMPPAIRHSGEGRNPVSAYIKAGLHPFSFQVVSVAADMNDCSENRPWQTHRRGDPRGRPSPIPRLHPSFPRRRESMPVQSPAGAIRESPLLPPPHRHTRESGYPLGEVVVPLTKTEHLPSHPRFDKQEHMYHTMNRRLNNTQSFQERRSGTERPQMTLMQKENSDGRVFVLPHPASLRSLG